MSNVPKQAAKNTKLGESKLLPESDKDPITVATATPAETANSPRATLFEIKNDASNTAAVAIWEMTDNCNATMNEEVVIIAAAMRNNREF